MNDLKKYFYNNPYMGYTYSYPHKSAYRVFEKPYKFDDIWKNEDLQNLFLYIHLPFCRHKCSYCNLFSFVPGSRDIISRYLAAVDTQILSYMDSVLSSARYSQISIGGGTPTLLDTAELESIFKMLDRMSSYRTNNIPVSIEISPDTLTDEKLLLLKKYNVNRISIGIQSFNKNQLRYLGRDSTYNNLHTILNKIKNTGFQRLNIDLIYGGEFYDIKDWEESLKNTLAYDPEEIYLYPLYIREGTPLYDNNKMSINDMRFEAYLFAKEILLSENYIQISKRRFYRKGLHEILASEYSCQKNGMVGLGCGSRSYTKDIHYSSLYSNKKGDVKNIISNYMDKDRNSFYNIDYGFTMNREESMRRYLLKSIFINDGLDRNDFRREFNDDPFDVFPQLKLLNGALLLEADKTHIYLTPEGMDLSDAISPWLYSDHVKKLMGKPDEI
jgi:oxygen-independent coproporphyrinogen III oxidase